MSKNIGVNGIDKGIKAGTCPHGLAPGACPVCSQSGGGTLKMSDKTRKVGEMTYHECAMIGNMLRARALAQKNHKANLEQRALNFERFEEMMTKLAEVMKQFTQIMSRSFITKPIAFVVQNLVLPMVGLLRNIPKIIAGMVRVFKFVPEIMDKLAAVFGEAKAFLDRKISELVKAVKSSLEGLFRIFRKKNTDDDDTKIDDDKKIFNLKTILHKVKEKFKKKKDRENERSTEG